MNNAWFLGRNSINQHIDLYPANQVSRNKFLEKSLVKIGQKQINKTNFCIISRSQ